MTSAVVGPGSLSPTVMLVASQLDRLLDAEERRLLQRLSAQGIAKLNRDQCAGRPVEATLSDFKIAWRKLQQRCASIVDGDGFLLTQSQPTEALSPQNRRRLASQIGFFQHNSRHYSELGLTPSDVAGLMDAIPTEGLKKLVKEHIDDDSMVDLAFELRDQQLRAHASSASRSLSSPVRTSCLAPTTLTDSPVSAPTPELAPIPSINSLCSNHSFDTPPLGPISPTYSFPEMKPHIAKNNALHSPCASPKTKKLPPLTEQPRLTQVFETPRGGHRKVGMDPAETWFELVTPRNQKILAPLSPRIRQIKSEIALVTSGDSTNSTGPSKSILKSRSDSILNGTGSPVSRIKARRRSTSAPRFGSVSVHVIPMRPATPPVRSPISSSSSHPIPEGLALRRLLQQSPKQDDAEDSEEDGDDDDGEGVDDVDDPEQEVASHTDEEPRSSDGKRSVSSDSGGGGKREGKRRDTEELEEPKTEAESKMEQMISKKRPSKNSLSGGPTRGDAQSKMDQMLSQKRSSNISLSDGPISTFTLFKQTIKGFFV